MSYSTKIKRNFDLSYRDLGAGGGKYILGAQVNWFKNAFARFFGIGNSAPETNESNYTSREGLATIMAGINLNEDSSIIWTERYRDVRVEQGAVDDLPQTKTLFPGAPGIEGAHIIGTKLTYRYDTRDDQLTPTTGALATLSGRVQQELAGIGQRKLVALHAGRATADPARRGSGLRHAPVDRWSHRFEDSLL